jgi:hypothetical protein
MWSGSSQLVFLWASCLVQFLLIRLGLNFWWSLERESDIMYICDVWLLDWARASPCFVGLVGQHQAGPSKIQAVHTFPQKFLGWFQPTACPNLPCDLPGHNGTNQPTCILNLYLWFWELLFSLLQYSGAYTLCPFHLVIPRIFRHQLNQSTFILIQ